ncbi:hypothetical protein SAMN05444955_10463 [Lihuaxuella thermophila]|uniref:Uncharacterized protein n=1 Tax=Lihuaxuella thermophila TaxID=1173111 RepID=A0A1H8CQS2_9BACL|nr:hypothetical protein SAMN05444955_10463 [Lihuaxuella thermophila]
MCSRRGPFVLCWTMLLKTFESLGITFLSRTAWQPRLTKIHAWSAGFLFRKKRLNPEVHIRLHSNCSTECDNPDNHRDYGPH